MASTVKFRLDDAKLERLIKMTGRPVKGWIISDGVEYGVYQEFGTSKFAARPFFRPGFEAGTKHIEEAIGQAIERQDSLDEVIAKIAFDVENLIKDFITEKHIIETGNLRDSIKAKPK